MAGRGKRALHVAAIVISVARCTTIRDPPPLDCTRDSQCAGGQICVDGTCLSARPQKTDTKAAVMEQADAMPKPEPAAEGGAGAGGADHSNAGNPGSPQPSAAGAAGPTPQPAAAGQAGGGASPMAAAGRTGASGSGGTGGAASASGSGGAGSGRGASGSGGAAGMPDTRYDGMWSGKSAQTEQGDYFFLIIAKGVVSEFRLGIVMKTPGCVTDVGWNLPKYVPITDGAFHFIDEPSTQGNWHFDITGKFSSTREASGTLKFMRPNIEPETGCAVTVTRAWSATKD